ncbi:MAG: MBL fold metallo-hydrolase [Acidobacteria bacterium]|nr:MBL fold metallo-hydrolase [Acidobacteriota bacterium]MCZ6489083.1 MBL fold metallo-hydrolase [Acidobacteriota bacterium]MCZ6753234.1 MBL fold metallo-hydrolase [Acidobacteriota bacterium]
MRVRSAFVLLSATYLLVFGTSLQAQDLGPQIQKIKDGIYLYVGDEGNSNSGIILTQEGVVLIDSGRMPTDSLAVLAAVKKLTSLPVRFLINTETHADHTTGHFVFSPPAMIINHEGASEAMRKAYDPERNRRLMEQSPEMRKAFQGFRLVTPQIEYRDRMTLNLGGRTIQLLNLGNVHSEANTAIWLPRERVLFAASVAVPNSLNNIRPYVTIPDMIKGIRMMKALNPEIVIPGHGLPGTTALFDDTIRYFELLLERVGSMVREGKSLDQIKQELRMPEYEHWANQNRMPTNIEAAYRAVAGSN